MENRRDFLRLTVFGVAAAGLGAPRSATAASPASVGEATAPAAEAPAWLVHPLAPGDEVGLGWRLFRVAPAVAGAVTVHLVHDDGRAARVDLCLRDGAPRGPAHTEYVDFIVMDGGDGRARTDESLGRAVRRLAALVAENEQRDLALIAALEPHADRAWRHPEALAVPRAEVRG